MIRITLSLVILCLVSACAGSAPQTDALAEGPLQIPVGAIVLRVQVVAVEGTEFFAGCGDIKPGMECIPVSFWYRYKARVRQSVVGDWTQPTVEFTHLQHAQFIDDVTRDCYVILVPAKGEVLANVGAPYVAYRLLSRFYESHRPLIRSLQHGA
jgi:hypothetical protein